MQDSQVWQATQRQYRSVIYSLAIIKRPLVILSDYDRYIKDENIAKDDYNIAKNENDSIADEDDCNIANNKDDSIAKDDDYNITNNEDENILDGDHNVADDNNIVYNVTTTNFDTNGLESATIK